MGGMFEEFVAAARGPWEAYVHHPWMTAIHTGTLTIDQFAFFVAHDMPYQIDFMHALTLAATRSEEPDTWLRIRAAIAAEGKFEEGLLADLGTSWTYDRWSAGPAREGYMNHLSRVALEGTPGDIAAALLPCAAGFTEAMSTKASEAATQPLFARWLAFYENPDQAALSTDLVGVFEREMARTGGGDQAAAQQILIRSLHHQIAVFDAAWRISDDWPTYQP